MKRRILSFLLIFAMLLSVMPTAAFAAGDSAVEEAASEAEDSAVPVGSMGEESAPLEEFVSAEDPAPAEEDPEPSEEPAPSEEPEEYEILVFEETNPVAVMSVPNGTQFADLDLPETLTAVVEIPGAADADFVDATPGATDYQALPNGMYTVPAVLGGGYRVYGSVTGTDNYWWACDEKGVVYGLVMEVPVTWSAGKYNPAEAGDYTLSGYTPDFIFSGSLPTVTVSVAKADARKTVVKAAPRSVPTENVTSPVDMASGETKSGSFTISGGGVVRSPESGTATISDGTVTNNVNNTFRGGVSSSKGSAFIARGANSLSFSNVTINSVANTIPLNIWKNASINANGLTLSGPANSSVDTVFMLLGAYDGTGGGSLNYSGTNTMSGITGTIASSGGVININSGGTLTMANSQIKLASGVSISMKSGANLVLDNSTLSGTGITVPSGATLTLKGSSSVSGTITVQSGGTLILDNAGTKSYNTSLYSLASGSTLTLRNGTTFNYTTSVIGGTTVNVESGSTLNSSSYIGSGSSFATVNVSGGSTLNSTGSCELNAVVTLTGNSVFNSSIYGTFWLNGTLNADHSTVNIRGSFSNDGRSGSQNARTVNLTNGAVMNFQSGSSYSASTGTYYYRTWNVDNSTININGGPIVIGNSYLTVNLTNGGLFNANQNVTLTSKLNVTDSTITAASGKALTLSGSNAIRFSGTSGIGSTTGGAGTVVQKNTNFQVTGGTTYVGGLTRFDMGGGNEACGITLNGGNMVFNGVEVYPNGVSGSFFTVNSGSELTFQNGARLNMWAKSPAIVVRQGGVLTVTESTLAGNSGTSASISNEGIVKLKNGSVLGSCNLNVASGATLDISESTRYDIDNLPVIVTFANSGSILKVKEYTKESIVVPNNKYLTLDENGEILASETSDGVLDSGALATIDGKSVTIYADIMNEADPFGITVEKGGKLILKKTEGDSSVAEFESGALLELKDGASFELKDSETMNLGSIEVTSGDCTIKGEGTLDMVNDKEINIGSGANLMAEKITITNAIINDDNFTAEGVTFTNTVINVSSGNTTTLTDCDLTNCTINVEEGGTLVAENCTFDTEGTYNDYYINVKSGGKLEMNDSTVQNKEGAAVAIRLEGEAVIENSTFQDNVHPNNNGGAIRGIGADLTLKGCTFENNTSQFGGAIHMDGGTLNIDDDCVFTKNLATAYNGNTGTAGAIFLTNGVQATIGAAQFTGNGEHFEGIQELHTKKGGAMFIGDSTVKLIGTVFEGNLADNPADAYETSYTDGGAICVAGSGSDLYIYGAKFFENHAGSAGGAIAINRGARVTISDLDGDPTEFIGNVVDYGYDFAGGAIFVNDDSYLTMEDAAIYDNYASGAGGGVSTCFVGSSQIYSLDGAAIFNNTVGGANENHPDDEAMTLSDVFLLEIYEGSHSEVLSERMFNGGLHMWQVKHFTGARNYVNNYEPTNAFIAGSNPTNTSVSGAKVVFTGNEAHAHQHESHTYIASGGAIACNGHLEIGTKSEIKIVKIWDDGMNASDTRPEDLLPYIHLLQDGTDLGTLDSIDAEVTVLKGDDAKRIIPHSDVVYMNDDEISELYDPDTGWVLADDTYWVIVVSGLEKEATYTVTEDQVKLYDEPEVGDLVITNKHIVDITVTKNWDDDEDRDGVRTKSVVVQLMADGEPIPDYEPVTLNRVNNWSYTWEKLTPYLTDGTEIKYTVAELAEDGIEEAPDGYTVSYEYGELDKETGVRTFTVTNTHEIEKIKIPVQKKWDDQDDLDGSRPNTITVKLLADYEETGITLELTSENNWKGMFTDLPKYRDQGKEIKYTLEEVPVEGYDTTITGNADDGFVVENKHTPKTPSVKTPITGDDSNVVLWAVLALAALCGICAVMVRMRKKRNQNS